MQPSKYWWVLVPCLNRWFYGPEFGKIMDEIAELTHQKMPIRVFFSDKEGEGINEDGSFNVPPNARIVELTLVKR